VPYKAAAAEDLVFFVAADLGVVGRPVVLGYPWGRVGIVPTASEQSIRRACERFVEGRTWVQASVTARGQGVRKPSRVWGESESSIIAWASQSCSSVEISGRVIEFGDGKEDVASGGACSTRGHL
jgi:hypothetical protein